VPKRAPGAPGAQVHHRAIRRLRFDRIGDQRQRVALAAGERPLQRRPQHIGLVAAIGIDATREKLEYPVPQQLLPRRAGEQQVGPVGLHVTQVPIQHHVRIGGMFEQGIEGDRHTAVSHAACPLGVCVAARRPFNPGLYQ
jgi:hypothetical protein